MAVTWPTFGANPQTTANPVTMQPAQKSSTQALLDFLGSKGGQTITNMAGTGLEAYGQYQQNQQNLNQNAQQFAATQRQNQFNTDRSLSAQKANGVLNADPLGASQQYAQKMALLNAILPNARNAHSTPGDPSVAGAMGSHSGGIMNLIPEGGFDPKMIQQLYGPQATMGALTKRQNELTNLDSSAPQTDLTSMFGPEAAPFQAQMKDWSTQLQSKEGADRAAFEQQIQQYAQQQAQKEQGSGFWHKFAKIAGIVGAGVATAMTAGAASPLLVAAIAAGSGAASSWGSGGSPVTGALMGAAGSAIPSAVAKTSMPNLVKTTVSNPALYGAILNR